MTFEAIIAQLPQPTTLVLGQPWMERSLTQKLLMGSWGVGNLCEENSGLWEGVESLKKRYHAQWHHTLSLFHNVTVSVDVNSYLLAFMCGFSPQFALASSVSCVLRTKTDDPLQPELCAGREITLCATVAAKLVMMLIPFANKSIFIFSGLGNFGTAFPSGGGSVVSRRLVFRAQTIIVLLFVLLLIGAIVGYV
eukprot:6476584-Amphidinium_carterae.1